MMKMTMSEQIVKEISGNCDYIKISLHGNVYRIKKEWLRDYPHSKLANIKETDEEFDEQSKVYFFNKNAQVFNCVIDYLSTGKSTHFPKCICADVVVEDLHFWGFSEDILCVCCWNRIQDEKVTTHTLKKVQSEWYGPAAKSLYYKTFHKSSHQVNGVLNELESGMSRRDRLWLFLEDPNYSKNAKIWYYFILFCIMVSILGTILESLSSCRVDKPFEEQLNLTEQHVLSVVINSRPHVVLTVITNICSLIFTLEILLRFGAATNKKMFYMNFLNVIDLVSILPIWLELALYIFSVMANNTNDQSMLMTRYAVQCFRFLKVFRLFKIMKNYRTLKVIYMALTASYKEFLLLILLLAIAATIFGHIIYFAEILTDKFENIPFALWWAVITMTTVGYGDIVPDSVQGYIVGCFCAVCGILVIAMPVPIIVNNFGRYYRSAQICVRLEKRLSRSLKSTTFTTTSDDSIIIEDDVDDEVED